MYLPCVSEAKVLVVTREAHDKSGHWAKTSTIARFRRCYWPDQSQDVERDIAGCSKCAKHGPATRSRPLSPIKVTFPFQLMGMDFKGPLPATIAGAVYILVRVCCMSRFVIPFACKTANVEDVLWRLKLFLCHIPETLISLYPAILRTHSFTFFCMSSPARLQPTISHHKCSGTGVPRW